MSEDLMIDQSSSDTCVIRECEIPDFFIETEGKEASNYKYILKKYLLQQDAEFRRLSQYRYLGWETNREIGDAFFNQQRHNVDNADINRVLDYYHMRKRIAIDLQKATGALDIETVNNKSPRILDICIAPGGFTAAALQISPNAKCFGLTLPEKLGGQIMILEKSRLSGLNYLDITMLIKEYSDAPVPQDYPQKWEFPMSRPFKYYKFDLIFCDGQLLRTQLRPTWREKTESTRLNLSQLILSMQRVRKGGTIVMLLYKIDWWDSILTIRNFSEFADIYLCKPLVAHQTRSSFYLVAKNIDTESAKAKSALRSWRDEWWEATFGGEDGLGTKPHPSVEIVQKLLDEFGGEFIRMARPIWKIQADALSRSVYAGGGQRVLDVR